MRKRCWRCSESSAKRVDRREARRETRNPTASIAASAAKLQIRRRIFGPRMPSMALCAPVVSDHTLCRKEETYSVWRIGGGDPRPEAVGFRVGVDRFDCAQGRRMHGLTDQRVNESTSRPINRFTKRIPRRFVGGRGRHLTIGLGSGEGAAGNLARTVKQGASRWGKLVRDETGNRADLPPSDFAGHAAHSGTPG